MKKAFKIAGILILAVILLALILAPYLTRRYLNSNGEELAGREIRVEKIRLNYLTFTLRVIGFKMFEKNDSTVFTGFDTLLVDLQPLRLLKSELVVKRLWIIEPVARIAKRDTMFNFSDIIEFFATADSTDKDTADFKFEFSDIRLKEGHISYTDEEVNSTTFLNSLNFVIPYLSWNQEQSSQAGLTFNFRNGGFFTADGSFDPGSGDFTSGIVISNLEISEFTEYIKQYVYFKTIGGLVSCNLNIRGNSGKTDNLSLDGRLSVTSFTATDKMDRKILGAEDLIVSLSNSMPVAGNLNFDTLALIKPYLLFELKDSSNNFIALLPPSTPADTLTTEEAEADSLSKPLQYSVNSFLIQDGIIDFADLNLEEPFQYHLSQINLNVDSVSSNSSWITAYSSMKLNEQGDLKAELGINPSDPYELKADYVINDFQLPDISPYSKFYVGSAIFYGNMYYAGKTSITSRQIKSQNNLIIRNAEIGKKSGGILNIPLRLALYIIKDKNGDIKIDLPVTGDLNNPEINIWKLVWTTFKNFIVKVAATPITALANVFSIDQKELQQIDFSYSDTLLTEPNIKKLDQLLMIKEKKPELNLELAYFNDRLKEKEQIALEEAGRIFMEETGEDYLDRKDRFEVFLKGALAKDTIDLYTDCMKLAGSGKVDTISRNRDSLRIRLIEDYLKSKKDPLTGIKIFVPEAKAVKNSGTHPVFEIKFSMED